MKNKGECPKCHERCRLTRHHIYPRRHFWWFRHLNEIIWLCRDCHDELEAMIPLEIQALPFYKEVVRNFLGTKASPMEIAIEDLELADLEGGLVDLD